MRVPLCDLGPGIARDRARFHQAIDELLDAGTFVLGPAVERFEARLAAYLGRAHAVGVASGSDALELSLRALGVGPGHAVVTTPFTFVATAESIENAGASAAFADISPRDWLLDLDALDDALARLPAAPSGRRLLPSGLEIAAVMPVHLFGAVHAREPLDRLRERHNLLIVEDAAQALGGSADATGGVGSSGAPGARAGAIGDAGCFSFFPTKTLGAFGDGGAIATDDPALASRLRALRQHGTDGKARGGVPLERGRNSRLDALQAAVLTVKLEHLDRDVAERRQLLSAYAERLAPAAPHVLPLWPSPPPGHAGQQMIVRVRADRDQLAAHLASLGVSTAVYYPRPLHALPPYQACPRLSPLAHAEDASELALALPLYPGLPMASVDAVCEAIVGFSTGGLRFISSRNHPEGITLPSPRATSPWPWDPCRPLAPRPRAS
jgi:dTDP-4-amino-4,6-dideoxygalactose transaminase